MDRTVVSYDSEEKRGTMAANEEKRREMTRHIMPVVCLAVLMGPVAFFSRHLPWPLLLAIVGGLAALITVLAIRALIWISRNRASL